MAEQVVNDVLAVIPDVNPDYLRELAVLHLTTDPVTYHAKVRILDSLLTHDYVKAVEPPIPAPQPPAALAPSAIKKRKAPDQNPDASVHTPKKRAVLPRFDYTQSQRPGLLGDFYYQELAIKYLCAKFGQLPVTYIRRCFNQTYRLVPAYLTLSEELTTGTMKCEKLKKKRHSIAFYEYQCDNSVWFTAERKALDAFIAGGGVNTALLRSASPPPGPEAAGIGPPIAGPSSARKSNDPQSQKQQLARLNQPAALPERLPTLPKQVEATKMECGCCFGDTDITEMTQCAEGHLFCVDCTKQNAETAIGARNTAVLCMDQSGCRAPFPDDQLRRVLPANTLDLLDRLRQAKELEAAKLGGLEHCPFCDFACIIVDDGRTFLCQKPTCMAVSCRKCRRKDHAPKTCEQMDEEENGSKGEHEVAEAMTRALIRDCPKCGTPFMKETGCNKMTCPKCGSISCYICRKEISKLSPYTHFDQQPDAYHLTPAKDRCRLWDIDRAGRTGGSPTRAHDEEVSRAEREARARIAAAAGNGKIPAPQFHRA
ncbi:hypothetical protein FRC12_024334 [Ceratobasidium sp. 428]|nr:hypothetical protein FRC12_024334 [Ceratobasidium sp. 428]